MSNREEEPQELSTRFDMNGKPSVRMAFEKDPMADYYLRALMDKVIDDMADPDPNVGNPALRNHWDVEGLGHVTRVEVIDETGRAYVHYGVKVTVQAQDHGGTLKVFVSEREEEGA